MFYSMRQLVQYKKEVKLQHLTVVQHQKVYDRQRSKMKDMHVNCIMHIILKKKKKRTGCATPKVYSAQRSSIKNERRKNKIIHKKIYIKTTYSFLKKEGNGRVVQHQKVYNAQRSSILIVVILVKRREHNQITPSAMCIGLNLNETHKSA